MMALKDAVAEVGWAGALLFNERTNRLIDGHARKELFSGQGKVPVLVGSWDEATEAKILATLDPLGAMATADVQALDALLLDVQANSAALQGLLDDLAGVGPGGSELQEGWGQTEENRAGTPKNVVAHLALFVRDVALFESALAAAALPGERPIDTVLRGLNALHTQGAQ